MRKTFAEVLAAGEVDPAREYANLYALLFDKRRGDIDAAYSLWDIADAYFDMLGFGDTSISLSDFDARYHFEFNPSPADFALDDLLGLLEYGHNVLSRTAAALHRERSLRGRDVQIVDLYTAKSLGEQVEVALRHMNRVVEAIGHRFVEDPVNRAFTKVVERDALATQVAEALPDGVAYQALSYRHRSYVGDLSQKADILRALGHELEPRRRELDAIDGPRSNDIFFGLNTLNIRHNNPEVHERWGDSELEALYDELYQLMLIAFAELSVADGGNRLRSLRAERG